MDAVAEMNEAGLLVEATGPQIGLPRIEREAVRHFILGVGEECLADAASERPRADENFFENRFMPADRQKSDDLIPMDRDRHDPSSGDLMIKAFSQLGQRWHYSRTYTWQTRAAVPDFGDRIAVGAKRRP